MLIIYVSLAVKANINYGFLLNIIDFSKLNILKGFL